MTNEPSVTVLGLGKMGYALALRFLQIGYDTTVWNRSADKVAPLVNEGARAARDVTSAARASSVIVACLLDNDVVAETLQPVRETLSGRTVINLTSQTPNQASEMASWFAGAGVRYLSGGIMATPDIVGTPHSMILYSGDESVLSENRGLLETLGRAEFLGNDPGDAARYDIALLSGMYGMFAGTLHALALMTSAGKTASSLAPMLEGFLQAMLASIPAYATRIDNSDYSSNVGSPLAMQANGFEHFLQAAVDQDVRTDLLTGLAGLMREAVQAGHGEHDMAAMHELMGTKR